ncbi:MAG: hypothetical protein AAGG50_14590 [Bacteroidota bacterium]
MTLILDKLQQHSSNFGNTKKGWNKSFTICTNYLNSISPNAYAWKDPEANNIYFVGLTAGLSLKIFGAWSTICSLTRVAGHLDSGHSNYPHPYSTDIIDKFLISDLLDEWYINPNDSYSRLLSHSLWMISIEWIYWHEVAHIIHGHTGRRLHRKKGRVIIPEFTNSDRTNSLFEDQLMEIDADEAATWWCLDGWVNDTSPLSPLLSINDIDTFSYLLFYSICILQHFFGNMKPDIHNIDGDIGYPDGTVRIDSSFSMIVNYYLNSGNTIDTNVENISNKLMLAMGDARSSLKVVAPGRDLFSGLYDRKVEHKPITAVRSLYRKKINEYARDLWRPHRLNPEPV